LVTDYTLAMSEQEVARYRLLAARTRDVESAMWVQAGVVPGAVVADVGCGPAAVSVLLGEAVRPDGRVIGVERDSQALEQAHALVGRAQVDNVELRAGEALNTGLADGSVDVAMMRHVLAHNGGREQAIVDHLAHIVRLGGSVYLVDTDLTASRSLPPDPDIDDLLERYMTLHRTLGNDTSVGLRLAQLLTGAGLEVVHFSGQWSIVPRPQGIRPPWWAARNAIVQAGLAQESDVERWRIAFERLDADTQQPTLFIPFFVAIGTRSA